MKPGTLPFLAPGALTGTRIVDLTWMVVGPWAPRLLAQHGAEVIKVERPDDYEAMRRYAINPTGEVHPNRSGIFNNLHADKIAVGLNSRHPAGLELLENLIRVSDAVVENFSAGVMESWGLGWERLRELNPSLVYLSMSGFGHTGPRSTWRSYGPTVQAMSGLTFTSGLPGEPPAGWGFSYMDVMGGFFGSLALAMGLYHSRRTGKGQHLDYSIIEAAMTLLGPYFLDFDVNRRPTRREGFPPGNRSLFPSIAPHNTYRCSGKDRVGQDYWAFIACETQPQFEALCGVIGRMELVADERFATNEARVKNQDALDEIIGAWTAPRSRSEVMDLCQRAGVIAAAVQDAEDRVEHDPQLRHREVYPVADHPEMGPYKYEGYPVRLSRTPAELRRGAPLWREHNAYVFGEVLGMPKEEIEAFEADGIV